MHISNSCYLHLFAVAAHFFCFVLVCCLARCCQEANPEDVPLYVFMEACQHDATVRVQAPENGRVCPVGRVWPQDLFLALWFYKKGKCLQATAATARSMLRTRTKEASVVYRAFCHPFCHHMTLFYSFFVATDLCQCLKNFEEKYWNHEIGHLSGTAWWSGFCFAVWIFWRQWTMLKSTTYWAVTCNNCIHLHTIFAYICYVTRCFPSDGMWNTVKGEQS